MIKKFTENMSPVGEFTQQKPKDRQQPTDSMTKVHFSENYIFKYMSGNRQPISIRIDTGLYERFKPLAKRVYGSVCHAVEVYITTFIVACETGVHFSNTEQPINIEKIVIARNLRPRRKLEYEEEVEEVTTTKKVKRRTSTVDFYDGDWKVVSTDRVNEHGHAVGCRCKVCSVKEAV